MRRTVIGLPLFALAVLLAVPFWVPSQRASTPDGRTPPSRAPSLASSTETLVVLTPHNQAIRHEMARGFREHMAARGRRVAIDWRSPGGIAEIRRYLASEYAASFQLHWTRTLGHPWTATVAGAFAAAGNEKASGEAGEARRAFLASNVGCNIDVLFGGGAVEFTKHAEAGRLVDSGILRRLPALFGDAGIPRELGGETYWDREGRWVGTCLSRYGICLNRDVLARLGISQPIAAWEALADPRLHGHLALADPTMSGSLATIFEMVIQSEMNRVWQAHADLDEVDRERVAKHEGWARAMRLIRRIAGNARYFTDASTKIPRDVLAGDAAAGMCVDFYGRAQDQDGDDAPKLNDSPPTQRRLEFVAPHGGTSVGADPIALLRGAPHKDLAVAFIEFVLSDAGQKLWSFRRGTPGGPTRYMLGRQPIVPALYHPQNDPYRVDSHERPYQEPSDFTYRGSWTRPLFTAIGFVVRAMCINPERELETAYGELARRGFPPRATATFDDVRLVDYDTVSGPILSALRDANPLAEANWSMRLTTHFQGVYTATSALAKRGE